MASIEQSTVYLIVALGCSSSESEVEASDGSGGNTVRRAATGGTQPAVTLDGNKTQTASGGTLGGNDATAAGGFISNCATKWEALSAVCPAEADALAQCWMVQEILDHECGENGGVELTKGRCAEELAATVDCG